MIEIDTIFEALLVWTIVGCIFLAIVGVYSVRFLRLGIKFFKSKMRGN